MTPTRFPLHMIFVWLALAAVAFGLASDSWDEHPSWQIIYVFAGATAMTLLPEALRRIQDGRTAEPGVYLVVLASIEFVSRMLIAPLLLWFALQCELDSSCQKAILVVSKVNAWVWRAAPLFVFSYAALRVRVLRWRMTLVLEACLAATFVVSNLAFRSDLLAFRHLLLTTLSTSIAALGVLLIAGGADLYVRRGSRIDPMHLAGVGLVALQLALDVYGDCLLL